MKLHSFGQFLCESQTYQYPPLQIVMRGTIGLTAKEEPETKKMMDHLYENYIRLVLIRFYDKYMYEDSDEWKEVRVPQNRKNSIDFAYPILNFTSKVHKILKDDRAIIFNAMEDMGLSDDKELFYGTFGSEDFIAKTVYDEEQIENLKLPIIGKPKVGYSAEGIEKFDTYEEAKNSTLPMDLWCEYKDIKSEFRAFVCDKEIIHISERIHSEKDNKEVGEKDPEEKINLIYIDQKIEGFPHLERIKEIKEKLEKNVDLDFYNIDIMVDKDNKLWVPEINSAPGIGPSIFYPVYKAFLKLAYQKAVPFGAEKELKALALKHRNLMKKTYPKEYKSSLSPK